MGLNVWHKTVERVLCSSLLPRGLDLGWLSFVSSILMTCFRQTFGNAFLAQETHFLEEISFHIAKWIWKKRIPLWKRWKTTVLVTNKAKCKLNLLDYWKKKVGHKWSKERQNTIFKKYPGFPQWALWSQTNYPCPWVISNGTKPELHWNTLWLLSCCTLLQPVKHDFPHK